LDFGALLEVNADVELKQLLNGTVLQPTGEMARVRGFMFFEFANDGLITKVTEVHDEGIIKPQLEGGGQYA
jgi:hypothetical protein